jgi:Peptidase family M48
MTCGRLRPPGRMWRRKEDSVRSLAGRAVTPRLCRYRYQPIGRNSIACGVGLLFAFSLRVALVEAQTTPIPSSVIAKTLPTPSAGPSNAASAAEALRAPTAKVQTIVDDVRSRLSIPQEVVVSIVAQDKLLVSVERSQTRDGAFALAVERDFLDVLTDEELTAVVAHELGHVWIFTHHPYLQTEELANGVALRLVSRETLDRVYEKVWQRTGVPGELAYLPPK